MKQLDKTRDFGIVSAIGGDGSRYLQDGYYFRTDGSLVDAGPAQPVIEPSGEEDLESLHWTQLRARVQAAGGTYTNKPEAIAFLSGEDLV
jgi:hypothetical protein